MNKTAKEAKTTPKPKIVLSHMLLLFASLVIAVVAIVIALFSWQQSSNLQRRDMNVIMQLQKNLNGIERHTNAELITVQNQLSKNTHQINFYAKQLRNPSLIATYSFARYLVSLANLNLIYNHNPVAAMRLLSLAKQQLTMFNSTRATALKSALQNDINKLSTIEPVNIDQIVNQLDQLNLKIAQLDMKPDFNQATSSTNQTVKAEHWWQRMKNNFAGLKNIVLIQRVDKNNIPSLTTTQISLLKQNIEAKILQAQWALLQHNASLYQQSLMLANRWLQHYFPQHENTSKISSQLEKLSKINISPELPTLESLELFSGLSPRQQTKPEKTQKAPARSNKQPTVESKSI